LPGGPGKEMNLTKTPIKEVTTAFGQAVWNLGWRAVQATSRRYVILKREDKEDLVESTVEKLLTDEKWLKKAVVEFVEHGRLYHTKKEREEGANAWVPSIAFRCSRNLVINRTKTIVSQQRFSIPWSEVPEEFEGVTVEDLPDTDQLEVQAEVIANVAYEGVIVQLREILREKLSPKMKQIFDLLLECPEITGAEVAATLRMGTETASMLLTMVSDSVREALAEILA